MLFHAQRGIRGKGIERPEGVEDFPSMWRFLSRLFLIHGVKYGNIVKRMENYMQTALEEAKKAADMGEIPVGAVIVQDDKVIAKAHNLTISLGDPTAHAEILAIRQASEALGGWRLPGCTMYVTMEPCSMCAGAIVHARIEKLYIGAMDSKTGACGSLFNIPQDKRLNNYTEIESGILGEECSEVLKDFFRKLRHAKAEEKR